jgi:hypothetical protein
MHDTDIAAVTSAIDTRLPAIAREVIAHHLDRSDPATRSFLADPDGREQHQTQWHQWGIITHTRVFLHHFDEDIPRFLREWGLWSDIDSILSAPVDGVPRWSLLRISILLHDIGKFGARTRGKHRFHFWKHEELSGRIIRSEIDLRNDGLTPAQIEYVARTAEDHFVLGLLRKRARERGEYDAHFTRLPQFVDLAHQIKADHPDDFIEVGILFLGDSLAKVDPAAGPEPAVSQYDVNIAVARAYLAVVLDARHA